MIIQDTLERPSIALAYALVMFLKTKMDSWMGPLIRCIEFNDLLIDRVVEEKCINEACKYTIIAGKL